MFGGRATYEAAGGRFAVDGSRYLVLNAGQPYTVHIDSPSPVESFCLFFEPGLVEGVLGALHATAGEMLDEPGASRPVLVFERTHPHDAVLTPLLLGTRSALRAGLTDPAWLEERFHLVAAALLEVHRGIARQALALPEARRPALLELNRRLHRARDHIEGSLDRPVGLEEVAAAAGLAPHHCLRAFRKLFGETPHRYLTRRRLERAKELLASTDLPVTRICLEVGFDSLGSFSWLFRRHLGLSPSEYRRAILEKRGTAPLPRMAP
jgi:AraC-like DNA-binding protein